MTRLDATETVVLLGIYNRKSLSEMAIELNRSTTWAWKVAKQLEGRKLVVQPIHHGPRTRQLTQYGIDALVQQGLLER